MSDNEFKEILNKDTFSDDEMRALVRKAAEEGAKDQKKMMEEATVQQAHTYPMGVSQWRAYGEKFGYWQFFEKQVVADERKRILEVLQSSYGLDDGPALCILEDNEEGGCSQRPGLKEVFAIITDKK